MVLKVALRIADDLERSRFLSLFEIIAPRLTDKWELADTTQADVVIIDANQTDSQFFLNTCKRSVGVLPIVYAHKNDLGGEWFLSKPVRVQSLIPLLNQVAEQVKKGGRKAPENPSRRDQNILKLSDKLDALSADNPLVALIALASESSSPKFFSNPRLPKLYYNPQTQTLYAPADLVNVDKPFQRLMSVKSLDLSQIYLVEIGTSSLEQAVKKDQLIAVPLDVAVWASTLHLSQGRLPKGLSDGELFQLAQEPDFSRLPHTPQHIQLAADMLKAPTTLNVLATQRKLSPAVVIDFFNACRSLDLVRVGAGAIVAEEDHDQPEMGGVLKRLFKRSE